MLTAARLLFLLTPLALSSCSSLSSAQEPTFSSGSATKYNGLKIESIQFEPADQPFPRSELAQKLLPIQPGSVFSDALLRQAIQNLFSTGRFADLAVDAAPAGSGVAIRVLTSRAYFVGRVVVSGSKQPPNSGQLLSATKLRLGAPYRETDRNQAVESLLALLRQNGFYHAKVDARTTFHTATQNLDLAFDLKAGKRARFAQPTITGDPERSAKGIVRSTHWKRLYGLLGWQDVTAARVRQGLDNLRENYEKHDRLRSSVSLSRFDYDAPTNSVRPDLQLVAGPRTVLDVEGADLSHSRLKQLVPIFQEQSVDADLLNEGQRNVAEYLQAEGYFEAGVSYRVHKGVRPGEQIITYKVEPGRRHKFVHLSVTGNRYFPDRTIRERMYVEAATLPRFPYGRFSAAYLRQDLQAIQGLYVSNGFRDVKVSSTLTDDYRGAKNHLAAFVHIEEGAQWSVANLATEGASPADLAALHPRLSSTAGQPYSGAGIANDRESILTYFYGRGYADAAFDYVESPAEGHSHQVALRYVITPGKRTYVRDVLVSGLETTKAQVVLGRIGLQKGQPLSITEETDSQRRLYDLGIFARVNTALQNPGGSEDEKYVLYDLDEARHYSLNVGGGAQLARIGGGATSLNNPAGTTGFAPRLAVGISRINLFGRGQTLGLQTAVSTIEQKAALTYFVPQFGARSNLSLTSTGLVENSNDIRTYTAFRREASLQLGQRLSRALTLQYRTVFRNVTVSNLKIDQLLVPLLSQPERLGLGEFSVIQDKRDDPADAHRGDYSTADLSYAPGFLGSQTSFLRGLFRNSTYHLVGRNLVLARSTQFGVITRLGGGNSIPLAERLYSGGSTSLRSFPDFQAGPRDLQTGFVLGGNASLVNNFELRFPFFGDNIGGVLFQDAGNVYSSLGDISFRFRQRNLQDFNYMVQSAGLGIRYQTPIGPIRLDFSFSPNAPRFFGLKGTLQDLVNNTAISTVQKINSFQFHFSLGQAF